ncbi:MAG: glycosyltransferase [Verrucomicrobia bacterium]|nr:glycosyltransferase [Verrucomicrobiota bacterium]
MKRIIVVLGPHRSGTSTITKGLEVVGASLGSRLMPADSRNERGYWEDLDFYALNREMLASTGRDWHHLSLPDERGFALLREKYFERASRLLAEKTATSDLTGLKDPRFCLLLPFWSGVFASCGVEASYVLALRHPASVEASLLVRDSLPKEKSDWIWILHMLGALAGTANSPRIVVDYEELLRNPAQQIGRLANAFRLEVGEDLLRAFQESFLEPSLNHHASGEDAAAGVPLAMEIHEHLHRVATDRSSFAGPDYEAVLAKWLRDQTSVQSLLALSHSNDVAISEMEALAAERARTIAELLAALSGHEQHIGLLSVEKERLNREMKGSLLRQQYAFESLQATSSEMQRALESIECWQKSWLRRAFTRWHRVRDGRRAGFFRRLERSIRKWRKKLLGGQGTKDQDSGSPAIRSGAWNPLAAREISRTHRASLLAPGSVLIVAELSIPQCLRYRVNQKAEVLESMGHATKVISWTDSHACLSALPTHGAVIFYRTPAVKEVVLLAREARRLGLATFFEIDDLVFDAEEYRRNSNLLALEKSEQLDLLRGAELYRDMLGHVDHAIGSTELITGRLRALAPGQAFTVENALDRTLLDAAERRFPRAASAPVTIVYGSGTKTHDADFALVANPLARVMAEHPSVRLLLAGPLLLPAALEPFRERVIRIPLMGFEDYLSTLARCDINLAPLEPGLFNDAKSNIKFLEASVLGLPSICSPREEFKNVIRDGENGFLAGDDEEWHRKLTALVADPDLRAGMGRRARQEVLATHDPQIRTRQQLQPLLEVAFPAVEAAGTEPGSPLKVLVVNVLFAPTSFGGATCVAEQMSLELSRLPQTEVAVFTGTVNPETEMNSLHCYEWNGIPVFAAKLPGAGSPRDDYENPAMARLFMEVLDCVRPDVVHFHSVQILSAELARVCQWRELPYVITLHDAWWICERQFMVMADGHYCGQRGVDPLKCVGCTADTGITTRRFNYLWDILAKAHHLLTPGAFFRELYIRTGVDADHISVNKNGVLQPAGRPRQARDEAAGRCVTFAFVGGRATHKGYFWLLEIFREIRESNFRLKIVDLDRKFGGRSVFAREWSVAGEVVIAEPYTQDTLEDFYSDVDVLLFPSLWKESFGLTVREALLRDIWVISTDCGGPAEDLRDGVNANIVPMGDRGAFRDAVVAILRQPEWLSAYRNPHKSEVRLFPEQALETREFLARAAQRQMPSEKEEQISHIEHPQESNDE